MNHSTKSIVRFPLLLICMMYTNHRDNLSCSPQFAAALACVDTVSIMCQYEAIALRYRVPSCPGSSVYLESIDAPCMYVCACTVCMRTVYPWHTVHVQDCSFLGIHGTDMIWLANYLATCDPIQWYTPFNSSTWPGLISSHS